MLSRIQSMFSCTLCSSSSTISNIGEPEVCASKSVVEEIVVVKDVDIILELKEEDNEEDKEEDNEVKEFKLEELELEDIDTPLEIKVKIKPIIEVNYKNTIKFVPPVCEGVVVKVYDGDTITLAAQLPYPESPMYRFQVRLNGIDCPEIKGKDEDEKKAALYAKNEMIHLVMNKTVQLKNVGVEKYGRILADVYVGELHVNQWMLDKKFAVPYGGATKKSPESWLDFQNNGSDDSN